MSITISLLLTSTRHLTKMEPETKESFNSDQWVEFISLLRRDFSLVFDDSFESDPPTLLPSKEVKNMPAAQPSRSSVSNVIHAMIAAGLQPGAVRVNSDGSFSVDVAGNINEAPSGPKSTNKGHNISSDADEVPSWEDGL